jgi:UDP-N-acetylglucosamine:LPS N-acetylglucosamine transferase
VDSIVNHPQTSDAMQNAARALAVRDSAAQIANIVEEVIS